jgi:hypothetical protein
VQPQLIQLGLTERATRQNQTSHGRAKVCAEQRFVLIQRASQVIECWEGPRDHDHAAALFHQSLNFAKNSV